MEIDWRIAEFIVQLGVAGGTLGLAWFALSEMKQNRKTRELEIFERYAVKYNAAKSKVLLALPKIQINLKNIGRAPNHDLYQKESSNHVFEFIKLCEREWFLYQKNWISKDIWQIWEKGMRKVIAKFDNHADSKNFFLTHVGVQDLIGEFYFEAKRREFNSEFIEWFISLSKVNQENNNA